jgi:hypothetical protein
MSEGLIIPANDFNIKDPFCVYVIALVLYSATSILYFSVEEYIVKHHNSILQQLETVHDYCNIMLYVLLAIGLGADAYRGKERSVAIT